MASYIRFGPYTNFDGTVMSSAVLRVYPLGSAAVNSDGSVTGTAGLPIRITNSPDGSTTNWLAQQNYLVTNTVGGPNFLGQGYIFRAPLDSGPTVYSSTGAGQLISGLNYFVNLTITNAGTNGNISFNQITNGLGFVPLGNTNLPALTNAFIRLLDATNVFNGMIVLGTNGFVTVTITNGLATIQLLNSASNSLYSTVVQLTNGFVGPGITNSTAPAVTNIFNALIVSGTNGYVRLLDATNVFNGSIVAATNGYIRLLDATNVFNALVSAATNGFVGPGITNGLATIQLLNTASNSLQLQITAGGITAVTATNISLVQSTNVAGAFTNGLIGATSATNNINSSSNLVYQNATNSAGSIAQNVANTSSNALMAIVIPATNNAYQAATNTGGAIAQNIANTSSNSVYANATNSAGPIAQNVANNSSNLLEGIMVTATNNAYQAGTNQAGLIGQNIANTSSNLVYQNGTNQAGLIGQNIANTSSNSLQAKINAKMDTNAGVSFNQTALSLVQVDQATVSNSTTTSKLFFANNGGGFPTLFIGFVGGENALSLTSNGVVNFTSSETAPTNTATSLATTPVQQIGDAVQFAKDTNVITVYQASFALWPLLSYYYWSNNFNLFTNTVNNAVITNNGAGQFNFKTNGVLVESSSALISTSWTGAGSMSTAYGVTETNTIHYSPGISAQDLIGTLNLNTTGAAATATNAQTSTTATNSPYGPLGTASTNNIYWVDGSFRTNTLIVDNVNGSDSIAAANLYRYPFATVFDLSATNASPPLAVWRGALSYARAGDWILIKASPIPYIIPKLWLQIKNPGVNLFIEDGATVIGTNLYSMTNGTTTTSYTEGDLILPGTNSTVVVNGTVWNPYGNGVLGWGGAGFFATNYTATGVTLKGTGRMWGEFDCVNFAGGSMTIENGPKLYGDYDCINAAGNSTLVTKHIFTLAGVGMDLNGNFFQTNTSVICHGILAGNYCNWTDFGSTFSVLAQTNAGEVVGVFIQAESPPSLGFSQMNGTIAAVVTNLQGIIVSNPLTNTYAYTNQGGLVSGTWQEEWPTNCIHAFSGDRLVQEYVTAAQDTNHLKFIGANLVGLYAYNSSLGYFTNPGVNQIITNDTAAGNNVWLAVRTGVAKFWSATITNPTWTATNTGSGAAQSYWNTNITVTSTPFYFGSNGAVTPGSLTASNGLISYRTNSYALWELGTNAFGLWNSNGLSGTNNFFLSVNSNGTLQNLRLVFGP